MMLSDAPHLFKSFLACPISAYMRGDRLELPQPFEAFIRGLFNMLREESDETFLALEREGWGRALMPGDICTPLDFAEMTRCDLVVAYPGVSCGVGVELGWASALGKPIILLLDQDGDYTPMIRELGRLPGARVQIAPVRMVDGFPALVDAEALRRDVQAARRAWAGPPGCDQDDSPEPTAFHSHGMLGAWLMGPEERAAADEVVASRSLFRHYGPAPLHKASALEAEVSRIVGTRHALAVSSGTAALKCALHALQLRPGDEVIVPACTFVATANAVVLAGGVPVFGEIDAGLGLDPARLESRITPRTVGIIAVHLQGEVCGVDQIAEIARRRELWLVEDAAQAFGCSLNGTMAGAFGDIGVFSLQAHKTITCGEGGLLVTDDPVLAARARRFQDQGGERDGDAYPSWDHPQAGFGENQKITEIQAAVALAQCGRLDTLRSRMQAVHAELTAALGPFRTQLRVSRDPAGAIPYSLVMFAPDRHSRRRILESLAEAGVPADAAYAEPLYAMPPFVRWSRGEAVSGLPDFGLPPPRFEPCPSTERLLARMVRIPLSPLYGKTELERIRAAFAGVTSEHAA